MGPRCNTGVCFHHLHVQIDRRSRPDGRVSKVAGDEESRAVILALSDLFRCRYLIGPLTAPFVLCDCARLLLFILRSCNGVKKNILGRQWKFC